MAKKLVAAKVVYVNNKKGSSFKGFVQVTISGLVSFSCRIMEGKKGVFVSYPSEEYKGEYHDVVYPISKEAREYLNDIIMDTWNGYDDDDDEDVRPAKKSKKSKKSKKHEEEDEDDDEDDEDGDGFTPADDDLPF